MIDENKEVAYFVYELNCQVEILDDGTYDDEEEDDNDNGV
jgi:hypothetical protein